MLFSSLVNMKKNINLQFKHVYGSNLKMFNADELSQSKQKLKIS